MEKECFSNTLKIESDTTVEPKTESTSAELSAEHIAAPNEDLIADEDSSSEDEVSEVELASEHGVVNIGDINESADIDPIVDDVDVDTRPETYHDRLRATRASIRLLIGDEVNVRGGGREITWTVIKITPNYRYQVKQKKLRSNI